MFAFENFREVIDPSLHPGSLFRLKVAVRFEGDIVVNLRVVKGRVELQYLHHDSLEYHRVIAAFFFSIIVYFS